MIQRQKITPCLWFDGQAEQAAKHYCAIFPDSKILEISHYSDAGPGKPGSVLLVTFELEGQQFQGLNGGPEYPFSEAISLSVRCDSQAEVDRYWAKLSEGGQEGPCGWLKDRFGVSWQIVPAVMAELIKGTDRAAATRVMQAMFGMKKLDIAALERAHRG